MGKDFISLTLMLPVPVDAEKVLLCSLVLIEQKLQTLAEVRS